VNLNGHFLDVSERAFENAAESPPVVASTPEVAEPATDAPAEPKEATAPRMRQAMRIVEMTGDVELFCTPMGEPYATIMVDGHRETWPLRSTTFRYWLNRRYFLQTGSTPSSNAMQEALMHLAATAMFANPIKETFTRIASDDLAIYINLADEYWRTIEITAAGWSVVEAKVPFRRPSGMLELPVPERGGSIDELRRFVNATDDGFILICAWILAALSPNGPYPILAAHGEPGCAKTTMCNVVRALVDPNLAPQRTLPIDERDLMITARNSHVLAYDNLSSLSIRMSDAFCKIATGGGHATRALYTDNEEVIFEAERPILLNGIEEVATRGDLADRAIIVMLPTIPESRRRAETEFWLEFEQARPRLLGAFLDVAAAAMKRLPEVELADLPRMADFAKLVVAAEPAFGWPEGTFLAAYTGNRSQASELTIEASPIAAAILAIADQGGFLGTASALLERVRDNSNTTIDRKDFPADGPRLSGQLRRIAPNLRTNNIEIEFDQLIAGIKSKRGIKISPRNTVTTVTAGSLAAESSDIGDGGDGDIRDTPSRPLPMRLGTVAPDDWEKP